MPARFANRRGPLADGVFSSLNYAAQRLRYILDRQNDCSLSDLHFVAASLIVLLKTIHPRFPIEPDSALVHVVDAVETRRYAVATAMHGFVAEVIAEAGEDKEKLVIAMLALLCPITIGTINWSDI